MSASNAKENVNFVYNFIEILKSLKEIILFVFITVIPNIVGIFTKNIIIIVVILAATVIFLICYIIVEKRKKVKGTFAVSAFIFYGKDNKLLLYRSENQSYKGKDFYVQPSIFYKKKKMGKEEAVLQTPYQKLLEYLNKELNIYIEHLQLASLQPVEYDLPLGNQKLSDFIAKNRSRIAMDKNANINDVENNMHNYRNNEISLSPWLTIVEKNPDTLKSSKEMLHIDFYYVFDLKYQNQNIKYNIKEGKFIFVSRKELSELIENRKTHGDLLAIYDILVYTKSKLKTYPKVSINNCTFTCKKKTAYWRITENCNCNCQYCFIVGNKVHAEVRVSEDIVQRVIDIIENNNIEKLVISGGEPLLVENLTDIVSEISSANSAELKISICTNGLLELTDIERLSEIPQFEKFVVSIDGYDQNTYGKYKKLTKSGKGAGINKVKSFIDKVRKQNIIVAANIILSHDLKKSLDQYIQLLHELDVNELSISTLITNNDRNQNNNRYLRSINEIMDFYNYIINEKMDDCSFLDKLDFIVPSCTYLGENCECGNNGKLMYISPEGIAQKGCTERMRNENRINEGSYHD